MVAARSVRHAKGCRPWAAGAKHGANSDPEARRRLMLGKYEPSAWI